MKQDTFYNFNDIPLSVLLLLFFGFLWFVVVCMFFIKIWIATSDIKAIREILENYVDSNKTEK